MGVNLHDATEITDPDEEWEDRLIEDPWWQRVIFDEFGEVDRYQVPRFAHWEDWRWWVRRTRPGEEPAAGIFCRDSCRGGTNGAQMGRVRCQGG